MLLSTSLVLASIPNATAVPNKDRMRDPSEKCPEVIVAVFCFQVLAKVDP